MKKRSSRVREPYWVATALVLVACSASSGGQSELGRRNEPATPASQSGGFVADTGGAAGAGSGQSVTDTTFVDTGVASLPTGSFSVPDCGTGPTTSISGTVFDPAGRTPLFNAIVYVPRDPLDPIADGVTCDQCNGSASGRPIAAALSDVNGNFVMTGTPSGNVPLVIQIGKWQRQVVVPGVQPCTNNAIQDANLTRLPRNKAEGHIPRIALTTGHSDALECLLRKIGIDESEFTTDAGNGRVHLFVGCDGGSGFGANSLSPALGGGTFAPAASLWGDMTKLLTYDIMMLSCEGSQCEDEKMPAGSTALMQNVKSYADAGGRLFLDHLHYVWLREGIFPWGQTAVYVENGADLPPNFPVLIDTSFPKGAAFADWLVTVGATQTRGTFTIQEGQFSVQNHAPPFTQRWIYTDQNPSDTTGAGLGVEYMTMNTPVEAAMTNPASQCGRMVFTDLHVSSAALGVSDFSDQGTPFPGGCVTTEFSPQERALEFMFFDLSSCVQPEGVEPTPPPIIE